MKKLLFEILLLGDGVAVLAVVVGGREVERGGAGLAVGGGETGLRVDDGVASLGGLNEFWVLLLEQLEVAFGFPGPDAVRGKDEVHFFQGALVRFRVEGPDHGDGEDVGSAEDVVGLFCESFEDEWQHHSEPAVTNGPANHTPGVPLGTDFQREYLGRVQPWDCEPGGAEGGSEEEDHSNSTVGVTFGALGVAGGVSGKTSGGESTSTEHGNTLNDRAPVQGPATTDSVKREYTDQGGQHVSDVVKTGDPLNRFIGNASSVEDGGGEDGDTSDTNPLLHDLKPDDELDTAAGVELARADTEEHVVIRLRYSRLALKLSDVADILELSLGLAQVLTTLATKTSEYVASFLLAADFDQPSRGFGEEPDNTDKDEEEEDLEGNREPPSEGGSSILVEVAAKLEPVCNYHTSNVQCEFNGDELPSRGVLGRFGGPDGNDGVEHASTPAVDQTSYDMSDQVLDNSKGLGLTADHPGSVHGRSLERSTDDGPESTETNRLDTTISVAEGTSDETSHEGAEIVDRNDSTLQQWVVDYRRAVKTLVAKLHHRLVIIRGIVHASHHTLIITEKENRQASNTVDAEEQ